MTRGEASQHGLAFVHDSQRRGELTAIQSLRHGSAAVAVRVAAAVAADAARRRAVPRVVVVQVEHLLSGGGEE